MGSRVEMKEQSSEIKEGIALSYSTANASAVVADVKTRKRTSVSQTKAGFPLGEFVRANKRKANVIGW